jgi:hypothetical protein
MAMKENLNLTDVDILCLEHDLLDWEAWVLDMVRGKIHSCKTRMLEQYRGVLRSTPEFQAMTVSQADAILNNDEECLMRIKDLPQYENRSDRDAREEAERQARIAAAEGA